ncbi:MAG TPA: SOS response-associated peptidase [Gammaproteobacteria bacterium]
MCGRYELNATPRDLEEHFGALVRPEDWRSLAPVHRYNIAPSQPCLVIRYSKREGRNVLEPLVWGFRPQWAKRSWINARDDTLFDTAAFRQAAEKRRCLVPATGWFEWQETEGKRKRPWYLHFDRPFAFAGVWTARRVNEGGDWELNFGIVTTDAKGVAQGIHDRMPLVLDPAHYAAWLDPRTENARALLRPFDPTRMAAYPVSTRVNDPKNDDPQVLEPETGT